MQVNARWVQSLREHGDAYQWCLDDLTALKTALHDQLAHTNPEKPYLVAKLQGKLECLDELVLIVTNQERKEVEHAGRNAQRTPGQLRTVRSA